MMLSLAALGPTYSVVYSWGGINPDGFLANVTAPNPDILKGETGGLWYTEAERGKHRVALHLLLLRGQMVPQF